LARKRFEEVAPNIRSADPRTRAVETYSAPAQPAAENEVADFIAALVKLVKPRRVLELGTAFGHTSEKIGRALQENGFGELDTLEIKRNRWQEARTRCEGLPVNLHLKSYEDWKPDGVMYDMAFFDSDRANRNVEYDLFKPYLNEFATLIFHDAGEQHLVTQSALAKLDLPFVYLPCPRGVVIAHEPPAR